jgi:hypothetical protein
MNWECAGVAAMQLLALSVADPFSPLPFEMRVAVLSRFANAKHREK